MTVLKSTRRLARWLEENWHEPIGEIGLFMMGIGWIMGFAFGVFLAIMVLR